MFNGFKISFAKNRVIMELVHEGLVRKDQERLMKDIAGNAANIEYALSLLKTRAAKCKYSASAAVFARLAALYEANPTNGLTSYEWETACHRAMVLAGANAEEAHQVVHELIGLDRGAEAQNPFGHR